MLSLYIHIPFCTSKCAYCSFNSMPIDFSDTIIDEYIAALKKELDHYAGILGDKALKTLYFGGGTPSKIGVDRIIDIIEHIKIKFNFEELAELSIELNPYPEEEVLRFVETMNKRYPKISRLRYSFGIQSFDDEILKTVGRAYSFGGIVEFLRALVKYKQDNNVFNFDFIAFGKFHVSKNGFKQLWHEFKRDFFQRFLASGYVDSLSLYTLENIKDKPCPIVYHGTDDEIMEEFLLLKDMVEQEGFLRYEISNFAKAGKASIHNMVYRNMEPYIGLGLSAASFLPMQNSKFKIQNKIANNGITNSESGIRRTNTGDIKKYLEGRRIDEKEIQSLDVSDLLIEEFFLRLRTREGISDITKFNSVLVPNYQGLITNYEGAGLVRSDGVALQLTDNGMNVYNSIITDLLQKI